MKISHYDPQTGELRLAAQSLEDLWTLSRVIASGDEAEGTSLRRFKAERGVEQRPESGEKKIVRVKVAVEEVEFSQSINRLRLTGKILSGSSEEFIPMGEHHTLDVEIGKPFTIFKQLSQFDKHLLREAQARTEKVTCTVAVLDDEKAMAFGLDTRGLRELFELYSSASKREPATYDSLNKKFFSELLDGIKNARSSFIVIAGPGFQKDSFRKFIGEKEPALLEGGKVFFEYSSSAEKTAVHELLKNGLLEKIIGRQKLAAEYKALEEFKASLGRQDGLSCYGMERVKEAIQMRAARLVMVLDEIVRNDPGAATLLEDAEKSGAEMLIFDSNDDAGREFAGFRISALLRYRYSY
ncbi:mRNA surveillance protein pelota [Candidatus Micrarchaeota archaeon]|nr:mRNA surveillance protein pelota [Candidatus Micrarchaeota archaeon]